MRFLLRSEIALPHQSKPQPLTPPFPYPPPPPIHVGHRCGLGEGPSVWPTQRAVPTSCHSISVSRVGEGESCCTGCSVGEAGRACMSFLLICGVPSPEPPRWAGTTNMSRNSAYQTEAGLLPPCSRRGLQRVDPGVLLSVSC